MPIVHPTPPHLLPLRILDLPVLWPLPRLVHLPDGRGALGAGLGGVQVGARRVVHGGAGGALLRAGGAGLPLRTGIDKLLELSPGEEKCLFFHLGSLYGLNLWICCSGVLSLRWTGSTKLSSGDT